MLFGRRRRAAKDINGGDDSSHNQNGPQTLEVDCQGEIISVAFLPDERHVVSGGAEGVVRRWQTDDGKATGEPMKTGCPIMAITVSKDGKWLVTGGYDGLVTVWNARNHQKVRELAHESTVRAVDISPDSTRLVSGGEDKTACIWSLPTGERLASPLEHKFSIAATKFSPDGARIATATWYREWHIDFGSWAETHNGCESLRVYADGSDLLFDIKVKVASDYNNSIAWSHNSQQIFALTNEGVIKCIDASDGNLLSEWSIHSNIKPRCIVAASNGKFVASSANSSISFWDTLTQQQIGPALEQTSRVDYFALSGDDSHLASVGDGGKVMLRTLGGILSPSYVVGALATEPHPPKSSGLKDLLRITTSKDDSKIAIHSIHADPRTQEDISAKLSATIEDLRKQLADSARKSQRLELERRQIQMELEQARNSLQAEATKAEHKSQQLESELTEAQGALKAEMVNASVERRSFVEIIDSLRAACVKEQRELCDALYALGRPREAVESLRRMLNTLEEGIRAKEMLTDWLSEFTQKCTCALETIGDEASSANRHDEAIVHYATALSLGPVNPKSLLTKWTAEKLKSMGGAGTDLLTGTNEFKIPMFDIYQGICEALEHMGRVAEVTELVQRMTNDCADDMIARNGCAKWVVDFKRRCAKKLEALGDDAARAEAHGTAIAQYTAALSLDPPNLCTLLLKRNGARARMGSWKDALSDADKVIHLEPSSPWGYERRHAALHELHDYEAAARAFKAMLVKLDQSPDHQTRARRNEYADPEVAIRHALENTVRHLPRVLIDTATGRLHNKAQQASWFEGLPIYHKLVSSMTTQLDHERIQKEVKQHYQYVTLSHRWEKVEPLLQQVENISVYDLEESPANSKLKSFTSLVRSLGFKWSWCDTCCIDKTNNLVLHESLVAMFTWYHNAALTIVHLQDVHSESHSTGDLRNSIWNTRAWTYQEYFASKRIQFYTRDWRVYLDLVAFNHKDSLDIISEMEEVTGFSTRELATLEPGLDKAREKLYLASMREATRPEDVAYSLFGMFKSSLPIIYGEGNRAVGRLLEHIIAGSGDVTVLAWTGRSGSYHSCLPVDLTVYHEAVARQVPSLIDDTEMANILSDLRRSFPEPSLATMLYDRLHELPHATMVACRLKLPGIIFQLNDFSPIPASHATNIYRTTTPMLGDVTITSTEDLSGMKDLVLIHPWIGPLLNHEYSSEISALDKTTRALRLVAYLRKPFGALLLTRPSRALYRRVAADSLITVRICEEASLMDLMDNVCMIDVQ